MSAVLKQDIRKHYLSVIVWAVVLASYAFSVIYIFPNNNSNMSEVVSLLEVLPEAFNAMLGQAIFSGTVDGWMQMNFYSMLGLIMAFYTILTVCTIVTREIDTRTIEYTLSQPISRATLILIRFLVFALSTLVIMLTAFVSEWGTYIYYGYDMDITVHFLLYANFFVTNLMIGGIILLISVFMTNYNRLLMIGIAVVLALYVLTIAIQAMNADPEPFVKYISPFSYMQSDSLLVSGKIEMHNLWVPVIACAGCVAASAAVFRRKEIKI
ncbi:MAG: ABC transporter permease [Peptococcaceae bacterium]|nr:ABC transporter permease [Peptococcaceae bacterium]